MGFEIISTKRPSGSRKLSVEPSSAEQVISAYIQSGTWKVVVCSSAEEARELQWYVIDKARPPLNKYMQFWEKKSEGTYANLLDILLKSTQIKFDSTLEISTEPGVYSLWHEHNPADFARDFRA